MIQCRIWWLLAQSQDTYGCILLPAYGFYFQNVILLQCAIIICHILSVCQAFAPHNALLFKSVVEGNMLTSRVQILTGNRKIIGKLWAMNLSKEFVCIYIIELYVLIGICCFDSDQV